MVKMKLLFLTLFLFILSISIAKAQLTVGISPPALYLGEIKPGDYKIVRFNLVTPSEDMMLVYLASVKGDIKIFEHDEYKDFIWNYSEEDTSSWVEFVENPVELKLTTEQLKTKAGSIIKGAREIVFLINVPKNAEPGYHTGKITMDPRPPPGYGGMFTIEATIPFTYIFKVPGVAVREGKILGVTSGDYSGNDLLVEVFFENTGTVTIFPSGGTIEVFDKRNRTMDTLTTSCDYIKPGEMRRFKAPWAVAGIELGSYDSLARVNYVTGFATKRSTIEVYERPIAQPTAKVVEKGYEFPWWVIVVVLIIIVSYFLFRRFRNE